MTEDNDKILPDAALDAALAAYVTAEPGAALRQRIVAAAPRERAIGAVRRWLAAAGLGLGLAASATAGVAAGYTLGHPAVTRLMGPLELDAGEFSALDAPAGGQASG
jgi:hypothetical protein